MDIRPGFPVPKQPVTAKTGLVESVGEWGEVDGSRLTLLTVEDQEEDED
jgi:hypothetical protein